MQLYDIIFTYTITPLHSIAPSLFVHQFENTLYIAMPISSILLYIINAESTAWGR